MKLSMAFKMFAAFVFASEAAWLRSSSVPDRHHALVEKSSSTLYFVKHTFKNPETDSAAYWQEAGARDYAQWYTDMHAAGMHFHSFFPISGTGPFYCVWEAAPGKTKADVQTFMDTNDASPTKKTGMTNLVMLIPSALLGGHQPVQPYNFGAGSAALMQLSVSDIKSASTLYVIKHTFKNPGPDSAAYWQEAQARDWAQWYVDQSNEGFYNHMFLPTGPQGPFYCIWEAKAGKTKADMQNWIDNDDTSPVKKTGTTNDVESVDKTRLYGHQPVQPHNFP